jgi:uncharacterized membrane protein YedE/YeeE
MISLIISLFAGALFAVGLVLSGMSNPEKVIGFLDVFGNWDYSLLLVMGGAVGVNFVTFRILTKKKPFCAPAHFLPTKTSVDKKLLLGSALFGIGWGILGICPGPAIVNLVTLSPTVLIFVSSMLIGMIAYKFTEKLWNN